MHLDLLLLVFFLQQGGAGRTVPLSFRRVRYAHAAIVEPLVLALEERGRERERVAISIRKLRIVWRREFESS